MIGIFGANGFVGRSLLRRFSNLGWPVRAVSRRFDPALRDELSGTVEFVKADIGDQDAITASLHGLDVVVQLAASSSPALHVPRVESAILDDVVPQLAFMQAAVDEGVRRYVFASSGGTVYGAQDTTPIPEEASTAPICLHGLNKLTIEHHLRMHEFVDGLEVTILRIANAFGPGQQVRRGQGLIPAILDSIAAGLPVRVVGDGMAVRDYVFIDDVAEAFAAAVANPRAAGIVNVGSGRGRTVNEVIKAVERELRMPIKRSHLPARRTDVAASVLDIAKAARQLGWSPRTDFHTGLRETIDWWRTAQLAAPMRRAA